VDLFAEDSTSITAAGESAVDEGNDDIDLDAEEDYDNWIVDDLQGGMADEPPKQKGDGFVKEMGVLG
jgi:chromosome transmission fidelity protein 4